MDMLDYAKSVRSKSFAEKDVTVLDVALLTELTYLVFTGIISPSLALDEGLSLADIRDRYQKQSSRPSSELKLAYDMRLAILDELATSPRFESVVAFAYVDELDETKEMQFAALTFLIAGRLLIIFRGTDSSLVGWKEDFNMAYLAELPSQKAAKDYLKQVLSSYNLPLIVAGHSKGGNLALYASSQNASEQLEQVYLFDAPGLQSTVLTSSAHDRLVAKVTSLRPRLSFVGTLYDDFVPPIIVKSKGVSALQHLMLLWEVDDSGSSFLQSSSDSYLSKRAERLSSYYLNQSDHQTNQLSINWLYRLFNSFKTSGGFVAKCKNVWYLLSQTSLQEFRALCQAVVLLFSAFRLSGKNYLPPTVKNRGRHLFRTFFYLPEKLAYRSNWLSLLVVLALLAFIVILGRDSHLNLLIFSFVYLLALFLAGVLSLYNWWRSGRKQTLSYLPGFYGLVTLLYQLFNADQFAQVLPRSLWFLLVFWTVYLAYQTYQMRKYLPVLSKILLRASLLGLLFLGICYRFPTVLDFLVSKGLILFLLYKVVLCLFISYRQWFSRAPNN